jgi:hypothetical protein
MKFKSGRGGARPGAGRPKGIYKPIKPESERRQTIGVRLPKWMVQWLKNHDDPAGRVIEKALMMVYKLKEPEERR